jgi:adenine-specific DNA-methyltransferase
MTFVAALQKRHEAATTAEARKERGQIFTPVRICRYMAGLFTRIPERTRLLDPGAGVGSLAAAFCERLMTTTSPRELDITLYESDPRLLPLLEENLRNCRSRLAAVGHELRYSIKPQDFILESKSRAVQLSLFDDGDALEEYDSVIMNPPYFKTAALSPHALAMSNVFEGQTNIYMMFMARAAELLRPNGEMVAITPRSYCSGLYFKHFRRWFFSRMALGHIHLFESRRSTFEDVLQESLITLTRRMGAAGSFTSITTSIGSDIPESLSVLSLHSRKVLDDSAGEMVLRIPSSEQDLEIMQAVEAWPTRFADQGLCISTGPVVLFRTREFLLDELERDDSAPLLEPHNVRPFKTSWPIDKRSKPTAFRVCPQSLKHLVKTKNYVLLRRFSAKEERRRLTASWLLRSEFHMPYVALENHLNYVYHSERELTVEEAYGISSVFNSRLLDRYFRIISGNTQVNATEIRATPFPCLEKLASIGQRINRMDQIDPDQIERIVLDVLSVNTRIIDDLKESSA